MRTWLPIFFFLLGCGHVQTTTRTNLGRLDGNEPCIGAVTSEVRFSPETFNSDLLLARSILDARGILPASMFCLTFAEVEVVVRDLPYWYGFTDDGQLGLVKGSYFDGRIKLNRYGGSLLHEMLHHLERGKSLGDHDKWVEKGYRAADLQFKSEYQELSQ